jgi:hypothetical protein
MAEPRIQSPFNVVHSGTTRYVVRTTCDKTTRDDRYDMMQLTHQSQRFRGNEPCDVDTAGVRGSIGSDRVCAEGGKVFMSTITSPNFPKDCLVTRVAGLVTGTCLTLGTMNRYQAECTQCGWTGPVRFRHRKATTDGEGHEDLHMLAYLNPTL